ncbi:MAG: hypothetical protein ACQKBU_03245 [Verrucomicrobiales bacterium]
MEQIIITGTTGVGKSLCADGLARAATIAGYTVEVSDHELFAWHDSFEKELERIRRQHNDAAVDISIIVINNAERDLQVTYVHGISYDLACDILIGMK